MNVLYVGLKFFSLWKSIIATASHKEAVISCLLLLPYICLYMHPFLQKCSSFFFGVCFSLVLYLSPAQNLPQIIVSSFSSFYVLEKCGMHSVKNRASKTWKVKI